MTHQTIEQKIDEILELLKPKAVPQPVDEWEDVTQEFRIGGDFDWCPPNLPVNTTHIYNGDGTVNWLSSGSNRGGYRLRKIDGLHNGPAFIVERRNKGGL